MSLKWVEAAGRVSRNLRAKGDLLAPKLREACTLLAAAYEDPQCVWIHAPDGDGIPVFPPGARLPPTARPSIALDLGADLVIATGAGNSNGVVGETGRILFQRFGWEDEGVFVSQWLGRIEAPTDPEANVRFRIVAAPIAPGAPSDPDDLDPVTLDIARWVAGRLFSALFFYYAANSKAKEYPISRGERRRFARMGLMVPKFKRVTLVVDATHKGGRPQGGHRDLPLHSVRGHWKDFRRTGLFGNPKRAGWYFVPDHMRGDEDNGINWHEYHL